MTDAAPPTPPVLVAPPPPASHAYVYAATDIRPRQPREIELCHDASSFDWQYTGAFFLGFLASVYVNIGYLKESGTPGVRLIGPAAVGFTWGGTLGGGYLSLPKCDPLFVHGPMPEGEVRTDWQMAAVVTALAAVSGPFMDWIFLGAPKADWPIPERSARVFVGGAASALGALFPYLVPPRTWAAKIKLDHLRLEGNPGQDAMFSYRVLF